MIELIIVLGFMEPCISLAVEETTFRPKQELLDIELVQKLKKEPSECGLKDSLSYKWIVTDKNGNQIDYSPMELLPAEVGLKNKVIINNQSLPRDLKPPLTFKIIK